MCHVVSSVVSVLHFYDTEGFGHVSPLVGSLA